MSELLDGHVGLDVESLDRVYLNGYVPTLQVTHLVFPVTGAPPAGQR